MRLIIGAIIIALMIIPLSTLIATRIISGGFRSVILPMILTAGVGGLYIIYHLGVFDPLIWDISMPQIPDDQNAYAREVRSSSSKGDYSRTICISHITNWVGKVDYSLMVGEKPLLRVRIASNIYLISSETPFLTQVPSDKHQQDWDFATGDFVKVSGNFAAGNRCTEGQSSIRSSGRGGLESEIIFSEVTKF